MELPDKTATPTASPLDAERTRLRDAGYTEPEISQILIAREIGSQQATGASQGVLTGLASNLAAVSSYARNFIPGIVTDIAMLKNSILPPGERGQAAGRVALKAVVILVIAYVVTLEFSQLRSATERAAADARRAQVEADAMAYRPCLVQGVGGCEKFGLNAAEAEAAAKTTLAKGFPTSVSSPKPVAPRTEPNADKQKEIQVMNDRLQVLRAEREAHGLTEEKTEEFNKLFLESLRARGIVPKN